MPCDLYLRRAVLGNVVCVLRLRAIVPERLHRFRDEIFEAIRKLL
jgi:hypothetical protein